MKLYDWVICEALRAGDWLAAINEVADLFELPRFTANLDAIKGMRVNIVGDSLQQIRIGLNGELYMWQPGITKMRSTAIVGPWIVIWARG